ncbi:MAG: hypothetical protein IH614_05510 [Desulfuromonadales bacterium]|nr:hypothetical protein [Desulfuromonadales bacterium]
MSIKKLSTSDTVKTRCSGCEEVQDHAVIAILDEETVQIQCSACECVQEYERTPVKRPLVKPAPAKKAPARSKADPKAAEKKEWVLLRPNMNVAHAVAYQMDGSYSNKALLLHSAFGLGLVTRVAGPHKVEVLFESGKKLLRCH